MPNQLNIIVGAARMVVDGIDLGYTTGGVKFRKTTEYLDVDADQLAGIARKEKTMEKAMVSTTLREATLQNMRIAFAEPSSQHFSGSVLVFGQASPVTVEHVLQLTGKGISGKTRTYTFTRAIVSDEVDFTVGARDAVSDLTIGFELLKDSTYGDTFGKVVEVTSP